VLGMLISSSSFPLLFGGGAAWRVIEVTQDVLPPSGDRNGGGGGSSETATSCRLVTTIRDDGAVAGRHRGELGSTPRRELDDTRGI